MFENTLSTLVALSTRMSEDERCRDALAALRKDGGFQHAAYGFLNTFRLQLPVCSTLPGAWWDHYFDRGYMNTDPLITMFSASRKPIETQAMLEVPDFRRIWVDDAQSFGIEPPSLGIPFFGPCGETAVVLLFGDMPKFEHERQKVTRRMHKQAMAFHEDVMKTMNCESLLGVPSLSEREKTALHLASSGSSNTVIAEAMGISAKTVEGLLRQSRVKLDASNTVQAVARAVAMGLVATS